MTDEEREQAVKAFEERYKQIHGDIPDYYIYINACKKDWWLAALEWKEKQDAK